MGKFNFQIAKMILSCIFLILGLITSDSLSTVFLISSYIIIGYDIYIKVIKNIRNFEMFDENFLMVIATIGALVLNEIPEAVAVLLLYQIGEYFGDLAVDNSKESILALLDLKTDTANLIVDGNMIKVNPSELKVDDVIAILPGEKVPIDGIVIDGRSYLDTKSITGESKKRCLSVNDEILGGFINETSNLVVKVKTTYDNSTVSRIAKMIEEAENRKAPSEKFITKFSKGYTPTVVILALLIAIIPICLGFDNATWINRALVFLVISCPCALVISVPLSFFSGIGSAAKNGILFKGSNELELISKCDKVVFDKTGTLTRGSFEVTNVICGSNTKERMIELLAYAEYYSLHPIASTIKELYQKSIDVKKIKDFEELSGLGIKVFVKGDEVLVGNDKLLDRFDIVYQKVNMIGTKVNIAVNRKYMGTIIINDEIKEDSKNIVKSLKKAGINEVAMLSGDDIKIVEDVAKKLSIKEYYGNLLPDEKAIKVNEFNKNNKTIFVGDGVNDSVSLKYADIGISLGDIGSDIAIEASDVVFMNDDISKLPVAINISKLTRKIVWQNIMFSISIKVLVMILGILGIANMWLAVFSDVGVTFLAILNSLRIFKKVTKFN